MRGVCGDEYSHIVKELNRLVLARNEKNIASFFVSRTFKLLPSPTIIVSYADASKNHTGYGYQACNFIYTGLSAKFVDPKIKGLENQHHATYANGKSNKELEKRFGDKLYFQERPRKHRYIFLLATEKKRESYWKN